MSWGSPALRFTPATNGEDYGTLHGAAIIVSRDWLVTRWNQTATRLLGIAPDGALGRDLWEVLPPLSGDAERSLRLAAENRSESTIVATLREGDVARPLRVFPIAGGEILIEIDAWDALNHPGSAGAEALSVQRIVRPLLRTMSGEGNSDAAAAPHANGGAAPGVARRAATEAASESVALSYVARALRGADADPAESMRIVCEHTRQLLGAEGAAIALVVGTELRAEAVAGSLAAFKDASIPLEGGLAVHVLRKRRAVISNDPASMQARPELVQAFGVRNVVMAPLIVEERPVGLLCAVNSPSGFTESDTSLLERLADQGSLALRSALLFRQAQRRAREARALTEIVRNINQSLEVDRVFELIARHAAELLDARESRLAMAEQGDLIVVSGRSHEPITGWRMPLEEYGDEARFGNGRLIRGLARDDIDGAWRWPADSTNAPVITVALHIGERTIGALRVLGADGQVFDQHDEELLTALAEHASIAIENARLYRASVRTMRHSSILAASARSLALHVDPVAMYADVWRLARTSLAADGIGIYLVHSPEVPAELTFTAGAGGEVARNFIAQFWQSSGAGVVASGRPMFLSMITAAEPAPLAEALAQLGVHSAALLPLIVEGKPRGMLALRFRTRQCFEIEQQRFLMDFASHAAAAVRNALLIHDLGEQAVQLRLVVDAERREREEAEAAAAIARVALRSSRVPTATAQMLSIVEAVVPAESSALALRREDGGMRYIACRGEADPLRDESVTVEGREGALPRLVVAPCVSHTVVPLVSGDSVIGVLALSAPANEERGRQRKASLGRLGAPLSLALASLLLREEEQRVAEQLRQSERLAALGELVAGVAHEVNNPLTGISAFAQLLQEEPLSDDQLESVRLIKKEADRAVAVMRDLLTFARKTGPRLGPVNLNDIVEQTLRLRTYGLRTMGIDVQLDLDPALHRVKGDDRQLQQVLLNLVVNAEHAMMGRTERVLRIHTRNEDRNAVVEVHDTGTGMSPEVQRRVFEPFFTTKPDGRGTGLGLSVSYGIVRNLQGRLDVDSTPGIGSCFRMSVPWEPAHDSPESSY